LVEHTKWLQTDLVAPCKFGARLHVDARDVIGRYIYFFGEWEPNLTEWLGQTLEDGDVFVDVGANVGYFTLLASTLVGSGSVVAIEAMPDTFEILEENIRRNGAKNVRTVNVAAWSEAASIDFYFDSGKVTGVASASKTWANHWELGDRRTAKAEPLESLLSADEVAQARVIKIDVEGAELQALRGLANILPLASANLEIAVEVQMVTEDEAGRWRAVADLLDEHGFSPVHLPNDYSPRAYYGREPFRLRDEIPIGAPAFDVIFSRPHTERQGVASAQQDRASAWNR
jgi:FkbM family methyltransferase